MTRAIELAGRASFTSPNPRVGCVLVGGDGSVVGEGWHRGAGSPHAEAEALAVAGAGSRGATAYISLEPCNHFGRTPPCVPALAEAGVARVVVALLDPDRRVSGGGVEALRNAGVEVSTGVLEADARAVNRAYLHHRSLGRPLLSLKLALSIDGRLAAPDRSSRWITGPAARRVVHARRAAADAVLIGSGTVVADDPMLTAREVGIPRQPTSIVLDARGVVSDSARLFGNDSVIVATTDLAPHSVQVAWKASGAEVIVLPHDGGVIALDLLLDELGRRDMLEVVCEGGARLATRLLAADLVDRLEVHTGAVTIGAGGPEVGRLPADTMADARRWSLNDLIRAGDDVIAVYDRSA